MFNLHETTDTGICIYKNCLGLNFLQIQGTVHYNVFKFIENAMIVSNDSILLQKKIIIINPIFNSLITDLLISDHRQMT